MAVPDNDKVQKKSSPKSFRIDDETANKLKTLSKDFTNQDAAFNAIMAAYEREMLLNEQSQFTDDVRLFEQYQQCLSAKFTDLIKALITADERAKTSVQQLLTSKDLTIQDLQQQLEDAKTSKEAYANMFSNATQEKEEMEKKLESERLAVTGLRAEIQEKEAQWNSALQDKVQLNEILSKSIAEKERELDKQAEYPKLIKERETQIENLSKQVRTLEDQLRETEYTHRLELLEKDKQVEIVRTELLQSQEEKLNKIRERYETELEKVREKNEAAQSRIQELIANK